MKIALPPITTNSEGNLVKQHQVFSMTYHPEQDRILAPSLDCPRLRDIHSEAHMDRALVQGINGFSDMDHRKVQHALYSCSSMVTAAEAAYKDYAGKRVAFAPVSGFHHAGKNFMGGFCTFNGLVAAGEAVRDLGAETVLVLDGDGHFGNGTEDFLQLDNYSWLKQWPIGVKGMMPDWYERLKALFKKDKPDMVLYQAGADAQKDDPYQAGWLTAGEFLRRDQRIFALCLEWDVPIAFNLAGGYNGAQTLDLHKHTFEAACNVYEPKRQRFISTTGQQLEKSRDKSMAAH